ncbi:DUF998 domain-containing protein, partial [Streptomyces sp. SID6041]|nr:DUF998 domain-containing protein [Streptomyces sp. SID6041]
NHGAVVVVGFTLLAVWPVLAAVRSEGGPWGLRLLPSVTATVAMALGAVWFLVEMNRQGSVGVAERLVTCVQSTWPLVVVASCLRHGVNRAAAGGEDGGIGGAEAARAADGESAPPRRPPGG